MPNPPACGALCTWGPLGQDFTLDTLGSAALLGVCQAGSTGVRGTELESPRAVGEYFLDSSGQGLDLFGGLLAGSKRNSGCDFPLLGGERGDVRAEFFRGVVRSASPLCRCVGVCSGACWLPMKHFGGGAVPAGKDATAGRVDYI